MAPISYALRVRKRVFTMSIASTFPTMKKDAPILTSHKSPENNAIAPRVNAMWLFYGQKFWEYLDTVFFILKGSRRQVSFLHVYHHCSVTGIVWVYLQLMTSTAGDGTQLVTADGYIPAFLNSFVHVLLYAHYFMRLKCKHVGGAKPWWAPYLTKMQLVQFFIIAFGVACAMLLPRCECVLECTAPPSPRAPAR